MEIPNFYDSIDNPDKKYKQLYPYMPSDTFRMFHRLTANADYTLCLEILNTDYQLWHKSQISVDKGTSTGLSIGNVSVRKLSHRYSDSKGQAQFMYYHRVIVNF